MSVLRNLLLALFVLVSVKGYGQLRLGEWREHLPYQKANRLVKAGDRLYCLTESGLFSYSLIDNEIVAYSKTNGLSESKVSSVAWSENEQTLLVAYANGNLDLISEGRITSLPDIKNFALVSDKKINSIVIRDGLAYLGTNFGIVVVHIDREEVADTYFIGNGGEQLVVNELMLSENEIWAATDRGIFSANWNAINLADFNSWTLQNGIPDFQKECKHLTFLDGNLIVSRDFLETQSELYQYNNGVWSTFGSGFSKIHSLNSLNDQLWVVQSEETQIFNSNGIQADAIGSSSLLHMRDAYKFDGRTFVADWEQSLTEITGGNLSFIKPDGPLSGNISNVYSNGSDTWAVAGGFDDSYEALDRKAELYQFRDQEWSNYTEKNTDAFIGSSDLIAISGNQRDQSLVYTASWGDGIFVFKDQQYLEKWNSGNSPLGTKGISGLDSDTDGNLWILDANSSSPVKVLSLENEWTSLNYSTLANRVNMRKILCLSNGDKWVLNNLGQSLFAFNENGTLANEDDDVIASFLVRDENNATISSQVYDAVEDEDGNVWLGTDNGVAVYANPGNLFRSGDFIAYQPIITIDGSTQYLLGSETVVSIAVDGANQKWLGTENSGVFLVSENADEQLAHFTNENSPLPSNYIRKISVNPSSGEVFFLTDKGMVSYKGGVTEGQESYNDLYVYPNPVRETYHGDIVVSGLMSESTVKITDISGNLVMEGKSAGGQYIWDGKNFNGSRVHTGVYLIFCSNSDGSKSKVIKLLFIH